MATHSSITEKSDNLSSANYQLREMCESQKTYNSQ